MAETHTAPSPQTNVHPANILLTLIVALLAPMFLGVCGGDIAFARAAALETVNDYRAQNHAGLLAVALIVAYGLAALGSLSLSMADDISLSMALRLRGNANALDRSAEKNRQALQRTRNDADQPPHPMLAQTGIFTQDDENFSADVVTAAVAAAQKLTAEAQARQTPAPEPAPAPEAHAPKAPATEAPLSAAEQQNRVMWAGSMARMAGRLTADLAALPPVQRRIASIKAVALTSTINDLLSGAPLPPFGLPILG